MRVRQWNKNLFLFAPLVFSKRLFEKAAFLEVLFGFLMFSLAASSVYIFNDLKDIESDRRHPKKRFRSLPSGEISAQLATFISVALCVSALAISFLIDSKFGFIVLIYVIINVLYSIVLKSLVIIDVMVIAASFALRVLAGATVVRVYPSNWLIICTILLSLFLSFSKRRHELVSLEGDASSQRQVLEHYSPYFLDQMTAVVTATTVMSYMLYTVSEETIRFFGTRQLIWTVPLVLYGIFRYLYLVHQEKSGGDPSEIVLKDKPLLINIILWVFSCIALIYGFK